jgi:hypothetical protein
MTLGVDWWKNVLLETIPPFVFLTPFVVKNLQRESRSSIIPQGSAANFP